MMEGDMEAFMKPPGKTVTAVVVLGVRVCGGSERRWEWGVVTRAVPSQRIEMGVFVLCCFLDLLQKSGFNDVMNDASDGRRL